MIEMLEVSKSFNTGKPNEFLALDKVNLVIRRGELTILKGPSGSGKTTLLSLVGCMNRPSSGRIKLHGVRTSFMAQGSEAESLDISSLPERFLTEIRRRNFGFIFQQFNLVRGISVIENITLPAFPTGENYADFRRRAAGLLEQFGISRHADSKVEWLSGGEMQRVAIARALINDPELIIADEPTAHLDSRLSREFMDLVAGFRKEGRTVVIASHDPIVFTDPLADRVIEMRDGQIVDQGQP
ncbi:MAG: ABC transporter ATP-binding protein [Geobacteraceae bacterium]|nr:ABC transporter ATP-binding protein [Geobacteraceae bacterium]